AMKASVTSGATVQVKVWLAWIEELPASATDTATVYVPAAVSVPLISPAAVSRVAPLGRPVAAYTRVSPLDARAWSCSLTPWPSTPPRLAGLASDNGLTVHVKDWAADSPALLVAVTVRLYGLDAASALEKAPLMSPVVGFRATPSGRAPL